MFLLMFSITSQEYRIAFRNNRLVDAILRKNTAYNIEFCEVKNSIVGWW